MGLPGHGAFAALGGQSRFIDDAADWPAPLSTSRTLEPAHRKNRPAACAISARVPFRRPHHTDLAPALAHGAFRYGCARVWPDRK